MGGRNPLTEKMEMPSWESMDIFGKQGRMVFVKTGSNDKWTLWHGFNLVQLPTNGSTANLTIKFGNQTSEHKMWTAETENWEPSAQNNTCNKHFVHTVKIGYQQ